MNFIATRKLFSIVLIHSFMLSTISSVAAEKKYPVSENIDNPGLPAFLDVLKGGQAESFIRNKNDRPDIIGFRFSASMVGELPAYPGRGDDYIDRANDGLGYSDEILCSPGMKCAQGYRSFFPLSSNDLQPFNFVQFVWNPGGYADREDESPYSTALLGVHFYIADMEEVDQIEPGDYTLPFDHCFTGLNQTSVTENCIFNTGLTKASFRRVSKEIPSNRLPQESFRRSIFAVPRMGAHHPDNSPRNIDEFTGMTLMYGSNDGNIIFIEPIIFKSLIDKILVCNAFPYDNFMQDPPFDRESLDSDMPEFNNSTSSPLAGSTCDQVRQRQCKSMPQPEQFMKSGLYPQRYCLTYKPETFMFEVTLESMTPFLQQVSSEATFNTPSLISLMTFSSLVFYFGGM